MLTRMAAWWKADAQRAWGPDLAGMPPCTLGREGLLDGQVSARAASFLALSPGVFS